MSDRCQSHDQCFDRLNDTLAEMRDENRKNHDDVRNELRQNHDDVRNMLHAGAIIHAQHDMRLAANDAGLKACEAALKARGVNWRELTAKMVADLVGKGIIVIFAMAYYAHSNGFGKG